MKRLLSLTRLTGSSAQAQAIRYAGVAAIGLAFDFATVIFAKQVLGFYYLVAAVLGFTLGLIVTYILSNKFVFGAPKSSQAALLTQFTVIGLVGLGILSLLMWILTSGLGINYIISKVLATFFVFVWNFLARRRLYDDAAAKLPYEL